MLRFLHKEKISYSYIPKILIKMRVGGISNKSLFARLKGNKEDMMAWKLNNLEPAFYTFFFKPLRKIPQFINFKK